MTQKVKKVGSRKSAKKFKRVKAYLNPHSRWNDKKIDETPAAFRFKKYIKNAM